MGAHSLHYNSYILLYTSFIIFVSLSEQNIQPSTFLIPGKQLHISSLESLKAKAISDIPSTNLTHLTAPYLRPLLQTLEKIVFNKQEKQPNIFDKVASALRLSPHRLKSDISIIQKKYIGELTDDLKTRIVLGRIILHTSHRQIVKNSFRGMPNEVFRLTQNLLMNTPQLAQMDEIAYKMNITKDDWSKSNSTMRKDLLLAKLANHPQYSTKVFESALDMTGLNKDNDFIFNLVNNYRFFTKGGKRYARRIKNERYKLEQASKQRNQNRTSTDIAEGPFEFLYKWLRIECGNIKSKIKNDIHEILFGYDALMSFPINQMVEMDQATTQLWINATYINPNQLNKSEKSKIAENILKHISSSLKEESKMWNFIDQLLEVAGFNGRPYLAEAVRRISRDKRYGLKLQHFKFLNYGGENSEKYDLPNS